MSGDRIKRAAEMLLSGATLLAQPCPYCGGVRVLKDGHALCVSCGSEPADTITSLEQKILSLSSQLGTATDGDRQRIVDAISDASDRLARLKQNRP